MRKIAQFLTAVAVVATVLVVFAADASEVQGDAPHPCVRACVKGQPMKCEYNFTVEWYITMSKACYNCPFNTTDCDRPHCIPLDGNRRPVITVNRQLPGPTIEVCEDDELIVHATNHLANGDGTTIHWHGIHQRGTPYMDGTPMVTQCPISDRGTFTYQFQAFPGGTHFYHSHSGLQMSDGLLGPLIIHRAPEDEPSYDLYDHDCDTPHGHCEFTMLMQDWYSVPFLNQWMMDAHYVRDECNPKYPYSSHINGRMRRFLVEDGKGNTALTPYEVFRVAPNKRYRFRVIVDNSYTCGFKVSVDGHNMTMIAADGQPVKPLEVDTFSLWGGERYDFILETGSDVKNYWLKAHALELCMCGNASAYAIVRYDGAPEEEPKEDKDLDRRGLFFQPVELFSPYLLNNPPIYKHGPGKEITAGQLEYYQEDNSTMQEADIQYYMVINAKIADNGPYHHWKYYPKDMQPRDVQIAMSHINHIIFRIPPSPPLSQPEVLDTVDVCDESTVNGSACTEDVCLCVHVVSFPKNKVVEIILVNDGYGGHPFHIHGYSYKLLAYETLGPPCTRKIVEDLDKNGRIKRNFRNPSRRDTVMVQTYSYAVIRLLTDNPGYWLFHCHFGYHIDQGQTVLLKIGDHDDLPPVPEGFPRCGSWAPGSSSPGGATTPSSTRPPKCTGGAAGRVMSWNLAHVELIFLCVLHIVEIGLLLE